MLAGTPIASTLKCNVLHLIDLSFGGRLVYMFVRYRYRMDMDAYFGALKILSIM